MNTIGDHLQCPGTTFSEHVRASETQLGESITYRESIYLDTNFWILLRDASRRKEGSTATTLLTLLRRAVDDGKVLCPISSALFVELMRQDSLPSRIGTAGTIDELSMGVTVVVARLRTSCYARLRLFHRLLGTSQSAEDVLALVGVARRLSVQPEIMDGDLNNGLVSSKSGIYWEGMS